MLATSGNRTGKRLGLFALLLVGGVAAADQLQMPRDDPAAELRARTREGEQQSRAFPQPPVLPPRNGIRQVDRAAIEAIVGPIRPKPVATGGRALAVAVDPPSTCLQKSFPAVSGSGGVGWLVCIQDMWTKGLWIGPVFLQRTAGGAWIQVIERAGLADIFVPYHNGQPRLYDMEWTSQLDVVNQQDAGSNGSLISIVKGTLPTVVAEVRERGLAWMCKQITMDSRRGEEFVVWGVSDAGNYDNIIHYGFRDDGTISFRVGHTGYNNTVFPGQTHMHTALWRVDMDLNGGSGNSAYMFMHREPAGPLNLDPLKANDTTQPFNFGAEGSIRWNGFQFGALMIEDAATNASGKHIGYEFKPLKGGEGTARHFGTNESWTQYDFHVTVYHPNELAWATPAPAPHPDTYLPLQLSNHESVMNNDVVAWLLSAVHHEPTDEDNAAGGGPGVTGVHWSGFDVVPHNLFDANPLGGPKACWP